MATHVDMELMSKLLKAVNDNAQAFSSGNVRARDATISACLSLAAALETPSEAIVRMTWNQPSQLTVLRTAIDLRLFDYLATEDGCPTSSAQLGAACSAEPALIKRMMNNLASIGATREVDVDKYVPTALSRAMTQQIFKDSVILMHDFCLPVKWNTPKYLAKNSYKTPSDALNTPVQYVHNAVGKTHMIQLLEQNGQSHGLASMMATWALDRPHWSDDELGFYPVKARLIQEAESQEDSVFLVDVGGSRGHDLMRFLARHRFDTFPGALVLQDLPEVVNTIPAGSLESDIRVMTYDFYNPQPVQGARAYFLHNIIHDYPDDRAQSILKQLTKAMKKGYSKLILWEYVLPDKDVPPVLASLDWEMLSYYGARERSESDWRELLEGPGIGLKVNGIWNHSQFDQSVIEAELV